MRAKLSAMLVGLLALAGCTLTQSDLRKDGGPLAIGQAGRLLAPKLCTLKLVILERPANDPAVHEAVWRVADAQAVPDAARQALEANGLRVGLVAGELPPEVQELLDAPPPHKIDPVFLIRPAGEPALVDLAPPRESLELFLERGGKVGGKSYRDAKGCLRLVAAHDESDGVSVKILPEVHHGPVQQSYAAAPLGGTLGPQQFLIKSGQAEESFRDIAASLDLRPGQVAVVGGQPDRPGSLGAFLFTQPEGTSDRPLEKVLLIWASRTQQGADGKVLSAE